MNKGFKFSQNLEQHEKKPRLSSIANNAVISKKNWNMHKSLCIRTLIESISGIKIEIKQQEQDKGKVVLKNKGNMVENGFFKFFNEKRYNSLSYTTSFNRILIQS